MLYVKLQNRRVEEGPTTGASICVVVVVVVVVDVEVYL
jgi:hypothetical protein